MTKMKVAMVCKNLPWNFKGGIQSHTWDLCRNLVKQGIQVSVICGYTRQYPGTYSKEGVNIIPVKYFPGRYLKPFGLIAEEISFNYSVSKWLRKNDHKFDLVHLQGRSGYFYHLFHKKKPIVQTVHGLIQEERSQDKYNPGLALYKAISQKLEKKQIEKSDALISVSNALEKSLNQKVLEDEKSIEVIPNGVKLANSSIQFESSSRILFVGRLSAVKNPFLLIDIIKKLPENVILDVVGDGEMKSSLQAGISRLGLENRIILHGAQSRKRINSMISKSDLLVLPSYSETQGIVLLEANANSVPVVASNLKSIQESVVNGFNGLLCNVNDAADFAYAIMKIICNPQLRIQMGKNGYQRVKQEYNWEILSSKTIDTYKSLLG